MPRTRRSRSRSCRQSAQDSSFWAAARSRQIAGPRRLNGGARHDRLIIPPSLPAPVQHIGDAFDSRRFTTSSHRTGEASVESTRQSTRGGARRHRIHVGHHRTRGSPSARSAARGSGALRRLHHAQWNGALTSGEWPPWAPSALPLAGARHAAAVPRSRSAGAIQIAALTTSPCAASRRPATPASSRPMIAAIAPAPTGTPSCM